MVLSPLHLALGETEGPLNLSLVRRACDEQVPETDRLEWKSQYPLSDTSEEKQRIHEQSEMAKDLAAMANGSGGLVVYGVDEIRTTDTSCASDVVSVGPIDERQLRTLRQVASNLIYPPIVGLKVEPLTDASGDVVVAVTVPSSPDAPHLIRPKNSALFGVPWRNGSDTEWMVERQIESAYRARVDQHRQRDADLERLFDETLSVYTDRKDAWIVVVASPIQPRPTRERISGSLAKYILETAWQRTNADPNAVSPAWLLSGSEVRRGLRRFRQLAGISGAESSKAKAVAEVHNDGSVVFAMTRGGYYGPNDTLTFTGLTLGDTDLNDACEAIFHILWMTAQHLTITSDYTMKLAVAPTHVTFRRRNYRGGFDPVQAQDRSPNFLPVLADIPVSLGRDQAIEALVEAARDALHQLNSDTTLDAVRLGLAIDLDE